MSNAFQEFAIVEFDGEPRARDIEIAERLGFARPRVLRELIGRHRSELETFGPISPYRGAKIGRGRPEAGYLLNEEQALLISAISSAPNAPVVRSMLIRTFVAWRRGHLSASAAHPGLSPEMVEVLERTNGICRMLNRKVTELERAVPALVALLENAIPGLVESQVTAMVKERAAAERAAYASQSLIIRQGKTAGQIWREHGFPPLRMGSWFGNRLAAMGCAINGGDRGELGLSRARLFDPDKAATWLRNGGRLIVEHKIRERMGQGKLHLVVPEPHPIPSQDRAPEDAQ